MKILVIGKKSRISLSLIKYFRKNFSLYVKNYKEIKKKKSIFFNKFNYIINCSSNKSYIKKRYKLENDYDYQIAKKIINLEVKQIFLSSRKIYLAKNNIKETDKKKPLCNYSKNKLLTEKKLIEILKDRVLILRISNLIGYDKILSKRKLHKTFIDIFFENIQKGYILKNKELYKDFISAKKFTKYIEKLILKKATGIFNISAGKKIYLDDVVRWLNYYNPKKVRVIKNKLIKKNKVCFYLNNQKLLNFTKIKISLSELENECKKISKMYFK
jgi:dTDP-4-dehydrorhamnose reductase